MIYAMRGHGRRANLYTDYTFAVWDQDKLVPFAKAYSGLTDKEINQVDYFVKRNTLEKVYLCMKYEQPEILMDEELRVQAKKSLDRMLEISAQLGL